MDKTKSKLAAFFDNDEEESSFPQKTVDDQKLSQYTQGTVRKSRREKEKEALEAKKREEEEHAARAYAEFLDAFEGDDANKRKSTSNFVRAGGDSKGSYLPPSRKTMETPSRSTEFFREESSGPPSPPQGSAPKPKGKRAMDAFLEEIKREQAQREAKFSRHPHGRSVTALAAYEGQSGSKDRGDPETSNVFVANLPSNVTEQSLGNFFARSGPVGSVKIMWPRGDPTVGPGGDMTASRRNRNSGLSGFVSFMKRKDAENALREFDGYDWNGSVLRVGWSKAVPVAAKPLYVARQSRSRSRSRDRQFRSRSRSSHGSPSREGHYRSSRRSRSRSRSQSPYQRRSFSRSRPYGSRSPSHRRRSRSLSRGREDDEASAVTDTFIRAVAAEVKGQGPKYEANLREWEQDNPKYSFLIRRKHKRHVYYRGLIEREDIVDPEFNDEGYNSSYSTDSAEESEQERTRKNALGKLARKRFEAMLRGLSGKRGELARCMTFSLEHAEAAREICDIIVASLLVDGTPVPRKVARLHLICDILHNSAASVPSAWKFRQEFQSRLGIVFDHLASIYHSFPGRITAETFKKQITSVVDIWEDWIVFPPDFTAELRARLDGTSRSDAQPKEEADDFEVSESKEAYTSRFKAKTFQPAQDVVEPAVPDIPSKDNKGVDGDPMDEGSDIDGEAMDNDGEPLNDDVDGIPIDDIDGAPIDDVDGAPIEDVDGEPMEEDVDGVPMSI